jgi:AcrR family transcriptional regulator
MAKGEETTSGAERRIHEAAFRLFARTGRTDLTVSELAAEAGVARGTVYQYVTSSETLFDCLAAGLCSETCRRIHKSIVATAPAACQLTRLAIGMRLCIRRAHDEPTWGRFICSFGFRAGVLQELWHCDPGRDPVTAASAGLITAEPERRRTTPSFVVGVVIAAIHLVVDGHDTWRSAGAQAVGFVLRSLGVPETTADRLAEGELPPLLPDDRTEIGERQCNS